MHKCAAQGASKTHQNRRILILYPIIPGDTISPGVVRSTAMVQGLGSASLGCLRRPRGKPVTASSVRGSRKHRQKIKNEEGMEFVPVHQ